MSDVRFELAEAMFTLGAPRKDKREAYTIDAFGFQLDVVKARKGWRWILSLSRIILGQGWYSFDDKDISRTYAVVTYEQYMMKAH